MSRRILVSGVALAVFFIAAALPGDAAAKRKKKSDHPTAAEIAGPAVIDSTFEKFHFGMSKDELTEFVKGRVRDRYKAPMSKTKDIRELDELRQKMNTELAQVVNDWIRFDGKSTGWKVSIIRYDFKFGMDEEALRVQEGYQNSYFFLKNGRVYKLVRTWDMKDFEPVRKKLVDAYGKAFFKMRPGDHDRRFISDMRWHGSNITVDVEDWTEAFKSYTVRWADAAEDALVLKSWGSRDEGLPGLNPLVEAAKEKPKKKKKDPVDDLLKD